eukprot:4201719-Pyramimonas_sp.AAC.1
MVIPGDRPPALAWRDNLVPHSRGHFLPSIRGMYPSSTPIRTLFTTSMPQSPLKSMLSPLALQARGAVSPFP